MPAWSSQLGDLPATLAVDHVALVAQGCGEQVLADPGHTGWWRAVEGIDARATRWVE